MLSVRVVQSGVSPGKNWRLGTTRASESAMRTIWWTWSFPGGSHATDLVPAPLPCRRLPGGFSGGVTIRPAGDRGTSGQVPGRCCEPDAGRCPVTATRPGTARSGSRRSTAARGSRYRSVCRRAVLVRAVTTGAFAEGGFRWSRRTPSAASKSSDARRSPVTGAAAAVEPGWPRRRSCCMADLEPRGVLGASVRPDRATPWAAAVVRHPSTLPAALGWGWSVANRPGMRRCSHSSSDADLR